MKAVDSSLKKINTNGTREVQAVIISNDIPEELPVNGKNVDGLDENDYFAPFSIIYVTADADTKVYIANEDGEFIAQ